MQTEVSLKFGTVIMITLQKDDTGVKSQQNLQRGSIGDFKM